MLKSVLLLGLSITWLGCSGCSKEWSKPGVSKQELNADRLSCEQEALKLYPVIHEPSTSYRPPVSGKLDPNCVPQSGMSNCDSGGPAGTVGSGAKTDRNDYNREAAVKACLISKGSTYQRAGK